MGYDEFLNNSKSRTFVFSIHSESAMSAKIGDALKNNYQFVAMNLLNDTLIRNKNHKAVWNESNFVLLTSQFEDCRGTSFYIVNTSSAPLKVKFSMKDPNNYYFSPTCGTWTEIVNANSLHFLAAACPLSHLWGDFIDSDNWDIEVEQLEEESSGPAGFG